MRMIGENAVGNFDDMAIKIAGAVNIGIAYNTDLAIDLTAERLSPRITYQGPSHFYYDGDQLRVSPADVWPLEVRNGVALGRHEPEPSATNLQVYSRGLAASEFLVVSDDINLIIDKTGAPDGGPVALIPVGCDSYLISQDVDSVTHVPKTRYQITDEWQRLTFAVTTTKRSRVRLRYGQSYSGSTPAIWMTQGADYAKWLVAGDYAVSWFVRAGDGATFAAGLAQIETGSLATSPVINEAGETNTRAESSVSVNVRGYASISLMFSNGSVDHYDTTGDAFSIPFAKLGWGQRYVSGIILHKNRW